MVNVVSNDTDPEGNYPLSVVSAVSLSGLTVTPSGTTSVQVSGTTPGSYATQYTVQDSLGATSNGTINITITGQPIYCANP
jgi:hypothetical protein